MDIPFIFFDPSTDVDMCCSVVDTAAIVVVITVCPLEEESIDSDVLSVEVFIIPSVVEYEEVAIEPVRVTWFSEV